MCLICAIVYIVSGAAWELTHQYEYDSFRNDGNSFSDCGVCGSVSNLLRWKVYVKQILILYFEICLACTHDKNIYNLRSPGSSTLIEWLLEFH